MPDGTLEIVGAVGLRIIQLSQIRSKTRAITPLLTMLRSRFTVPRLKRVASAAVWKTKLPLPSMSHPALAPRSIQMECRDEKLR